jgi:hypothetical protein
MLFKYLASAKITVLVVVIALAQTLVYAGLGGSTATSRLLVTEAVQQTGSLVNGRLIVKQRSGVSVNGNPAPSGTTVFPGAEIATSDNVPATLDLSPVGRLDLDPNARVIVTFSDSGIDVTLISGCVFLRMQKPGAVGVVHGPQGAAAQTSANSSQVDVCYKPGDAELTPGQHTSSGAGVRRKGGLFGLGTAATIAILAGAGATTTILIATGRGGNPSPVTP